MAAPRKNRNLNVVNPQSAESSPVTENPTESAPAEVKNLYLSHRDNCDAREESYPVTRPNGDQVTVHRCMDCGAHQLEG